MRSKMAMRASAVFTGVVLMITLSACSDSSLTGGGGFKDVEKVKPQDAQSYVLLNNVDGFPNIVRVCQDGVAFATTTREAAGAILRVPEWDRFCPGYVAPVR
jgi:hypothetical protein